MERLPQTRRRHRLLRSLPLLLLVLAGSLAACAPTALPVRTTHHYRQLGHRWAEGARTPDGLRDGNWVFFDADGVVEAKGGFHRGKMHGTWTFWFPSGTVRTVDYSDGDRVTAFIGWN